MASAVLASPPAKRFVEITISTAGSLLGTWIAGAFEGGPSLRLGGAILGALVPALLSEVLPKTKTRPAAALVVALIATLLTYFTLTAADFARESSSTFPLPPGVSSPLADPPDLPVAVAPPSATHAAPPSPPARSATSPPPPNRRAAPPPPPTRRAVPPSPPTTPVTRRATDGGRDEVVPKGVVPNISSIFATSAPTTHPPRLPRETAVARPAA
jgi:hypothetical protein